jgi:mono/diheme cytochrome c family protein
MTDGSLNRHRLWTSLGWVVLAVAVLALAGFAAIAFKPAIASVPTPRREAFRPELIRQGATLAAAGFCTTCHTNESGKVLAGGRALETPFGTIFGSNITPDRETGIGDWSLEAFRRAMRDGVDRDGRHLYPAFPYNHFTQLTDGDVEALYAYVMTRVPVHAVTPEPDFAFPFNIRPILAGWNLLFLHKGPVPSDPSRSPAWNRGAYLAEALAHCGACHTPRNRLGAEIAGRHFGGGEAEDWWAPPLDASSPAPVAWTEENLFNYLRSWDSAHGGGVGPMQPVVAGLSQLPVEDVRALATYVASTMGSQTGRGVKQAAMAPPSSDPAVARGGEVFHGACASCHESGATVPFTVASLGQHTTLFAPDPRNVIHVVLGGIAPGEGEVGGMMPAFAGTLTEAQITDLLAYLRTRYTDQAPWPNAAAEVHRLASPGR